MALLAAALALALVLQWHLRLLAPYTNEARECPVPAPPPGNQAQDLPGPWLCLACRMQRSLRS